MIITIYVAKSKALINCMVTAADLRLCFRICKKQVFHDTAHLKLHIFILPSGVHSSDCFADNKLAHFCRITFCSRDRLVPIKHGFWYSNVSSGSCNKYRRTHKERYNTYLMIIKLFLLLARRYSSVGSNVPWESRGMAIDQRAWHSFS